MKDKFKVIVKHPIAGNYPLRKEIARPDQVNDLHAQLTNLVFEVHCLTLEEQFLTNHMPHLKNEPWSETIEDLAKFYTKDECLNVDINIIRDHPIYEIYKEFDQNFNNLKFVFNGRLMFTATLI